MSAHTSSPTLSRRLELNFHADDYRILEKAADAVGLSIREYCHLVAIRWVRETSAPGEPVTSLKRALMLRIHPADYALIERAAEAVGYSVEDYSRLSLYLHTKDVLLRLRKTAVDDESEPIRGARF